MMKTTDKKTILVTGASSGIGNAIALHLARKGYSVLATVRKQADADRLKEHGINRLIPLYPLDLTEPRQIEEIAAHVKHGISAGQLPPLYAIINVAGGGQIAPIELMNVDAYRLELEKRLVGPIVLLQELLPLLRATRGRIVWIATPGLLPLPYVTDIHAPDFAVNYLARTLNLELLPDGIRNTLIRCGGISTPSPERSEKQLDDMLHQWPEKRFAIYKNRLLKLQKELAHFGIKRTAPEKVALTVEKALLAKHPRTKYQVGYMSRLGAVMENLPQSWADWIMEKRNR